jgi:hypothetical protein
MTTKYWFIHAGQDDDELLELTVEEQEEANEELYDSQLELNFE